MSLPPPSGPKQPLHPPTSLPPRPPLPAAPPPGSFPPAYSAAPAYAHTTSAVPGIVGPGYGGNGANPTSKTSGTGYNSFTAFQPRSITSSSQTYRTSSPVVAGPTTPPVGFPASTMATATATAAATAATTSTSGYGATYPNQQRPYQTGSTYYSQQNYGDHSYGQASSVPQIANPFPPPAPDQSNNYTRGKGYGRHDSGLDPEMEAQIAQWQSAYIAKDGDPPAGVKTAGRRDPTAVATGINAAPVSIPSNGPTAASTPTPGPGRTDPGPKTVVRSGGGQTWTDPSLLEWDPAHFRLFVGNLAGEVTDDSLKKAFAKYPSVQRARVIRDKQSEKSKGYGFVSFSDGDDYFKAAREMQGKYIGSHPVLLRRATTEVRPVSAKAKKGGNGILGTGGNQNHGAGGGGKVKNDGVKKHGKTKGGLRILG
ncbi:hypothetical protein Egran_05386 [Elaphomyces granulatus]|uniref:RRM domain-containing protein n=1 Tax=Elaphomyces granulatus TaxID=519963 RepID=A0A232LSQ7_9EURO|nr:hypothetical protein Egran_05386 [Elaphomyces granulatus]